MNRRLGLSLLVVVAAGAILSAPAGASLRQIAVGNFYFEDETVGDGKVTAQVGDQLRFSVLDGGPGTPHTVDVDELGIHSGSLRSGETFTTPPISKAGTFILYCKPHDQRGHKATLVVSGTSVTPPTTASTTTTTAPTTTTTVKATTSTKPSVTTATTASPGTGSSTTTAARPTTTAVPTTATTGPATTSFGGSAGPTGSGSASVSAGSVLTGENTPVVPPAPDTAGTDPSGDPLSPVGRGTIGATPEAAGSLNDFLDRLPERNGPWIRSVRLALAALLPMALAVGVALRRWSPPPPGADDE